MKRISATSLIEDRELDGDADSRQIIATAFADVMEHLEKIAEKEEVTPDWRTLDLRFFRDVHRDEEQKLVRDEHLTLRVMVLGSPK
jgi:hypothetical protein